MDNDRVFSLCALTLVAAVASLLTASIATGIAALPEAGGFLGHLALSLGFRAAYKSFGGFDWIYRAAELAGMITPDPALPPDIAAGAIG